jgi:hypothetical protein
VQRYSFIADDIRFEAITGGDQNGFGNASLTYHFIKSRLALAR